ncbi:heterokaryon incompatibility protein-domain-containing protein [Nemania sp. FL0916]|nr:heterokaryon incompatibility protein-domain-containing protein [Nemania sp. FL0916]
MSNHQSFRAAGPSNLDGIIRFLDDGGLPNTRWSMDELKIPRGYASTWPHWNTPLHRMIATGQQDAMRYLLDHGADVHFCNSLGRTPLQEAARLEYHDGVELLVVHGANVNLPSQGRSAGSEIGDHDDLTGSDVYVLPIHEAIRNGDDQMIRVLVHAGAIVNQASQGWWPRDLALIDRQANLIDTLVELGASFSPNWQSESYSESQEGEESAVLLNAASHPDWFPPQSCRPIYESILTSLNVDQYITARSCIKQKIKSNELIRDFFKVLSLKAKRTSIEPAEDMLCSLCFEYQTQASYPSCSCLSGDVTQFETLCFRHHNSLESLVSSADSGCRLCLVLMQSLKLLKNKGALVPPEIEKYLQISKSEVYLHLQRPRRLFITAGDLAVELELGYLKENTIRHSPSIDDYENGTSSSSSFQIAKTWLHECTANHVACSHGSVPLPTRVIDVGDGSRDPFLFESKGAHHDYCALSYCWGTSSNAHQTTTKNLQEYYAAISPHKLPPTLLDAIHAARVIGFKYIWIDALCIIQDDNDDWSHEAIKMTQVYANATLTITTTVGGSSHDGLFRPHPDGFFNPQQLHLRLPKRDRLREQLPYRDSIFPNDNSKRSLSYLAVYPGANFPWVGFQYIGAEGGPVEERAWTLQEHIFSKRVLYYSNGAILWECMEISVSEHDPDGVGSGIQHPDRWQIKEYFHSHLGSQAKGLTSSTNGTPCPQKDFSTYCRLLATYANRLITKPSDRITAMLGLGQVIQKVSGDEFIGGILKGDNTLASLMWGIENPSPWDRVRIFPSWSWASVLPEPDGRSGFFNNLGETESEIHWQARVVSFDVQSNLVQTYVSGRITLEGRLGRLSHDENYVKSLKRTLHVTPHVFMDLATDKNSLENDLENIWCLEMATLNGDQDLLSKACLLLRQVDCAGGQTFERVGVYQHIIGGETSKVQTVVIV